MNVNGKSICNNKSDRTSDFCSTNRQHCCMPGTLVMLIRTFLRTHNVNMVTTLQRNLVFSQPFHDFIGQLIPVSSSTSRLISTRKTHFSIVFLPRADWRIMVILKPEQKDAIVNWWRAEDKDARGFLRPGRLRTAAQIYHISSRRMTEIIHDYRVMHPDGAQPHHINRRTGGQVGRQLQLTPAKRAAMLEVAQIHRWQNLLHWPLVASWHERPRPCACIVSNSEVEETNGGVSATTRISSLLSHLSRKLIELHLLTRRRSRMACISSHQTTKSTLMKPGITWTGMHSISCGFLDNCLVLLAEPSQSGTSPRSCA